MDENTSALETESPPPITEEEDVKPLSTGEEASIEARKLPQYVAALSVTLGAFALGTALGWSSTANPKLEDDDELNPTDDQLSWIGSMLTIGAAIVTFPSGYCMEKIGRKRTMLILVIPFLIGWILLAFYKNIAMLYVGRFILGMSGGAFSIIAPVYIGEIAHRDIRGTLTSYFQLMITMGILYSYAIGPYVSVEVFSMLCGILPLVFAVIFFFMPESPLYLLKKNKRESAEKVMRYFRGPSYDIAPEMEEMETSIEEVRSRELSIGMFLTPAAIKADIISFGLMFFQQMEGINAVIFYTEDIFNDAKVDMDANISTIIVGVVQVLATFVSTLVLDRAGRRVMLVISYSIMGICAVMLGYFFYMKDNSGEDSVKDLGWLPLSSMALYIIAFSLGNGPIPWVMVGEIFPAEIKGFIGSISCMFNWLLAFVVTRFYGPLAKAIGTGVTFWIFAAVCFVGVVFVLTFVIETKGKSLEQIQRELSGKKRKVREGVVDAPENQTEAVDENEKDNET